MIPFFFAPMVSSSGKDRGTCDLDHRFGPCIRQTKPDIQVDKGRGTAHYPRGSRSGDDPKDSPIGISWSSNKNHLQEEVLLGFGYNSDKEIHKTLIIS